MVETPQPPVHMPLFVPATEENPKPRKPEDFNNRFPIEELDKSCNQVVKKLDVYTAGLVQGDLRFNTRFRGNFNDPPNYTFPETNNSIELGPVSTGNLYLYYKYEGEVEYQTEKGEMDKCFYGQMSTRPIAIEEKVPIEFHDSTPRNDASGREWNVLKGEDFIEFKKKYPVVLVEKAKGVVRFIDCPGGPAGAFGVGWEGKKIYIMLYAGTCNRVTHVKVFRIDYPVGKRPKMTEIKSDKDLLQEVPSFSYSPLPFPS